MSDPEAIPLEDGEDAEYPLSKPANGDGLVLDDGTSKSHKRTTIAFAICAVFFCAVVVTVIAVGAGSGDGGGGGEPEPETPPAAAAPAPSIADAIDMPRLMAHLHEFEKIAGQFSGSRSVENGFNASVDYVLGVLRAQAPSLRVWTQSFEVDMYKTVVPPTLLMEAPFAIVFKIGTDFLPFHGFAGAADVPEYVAAPPGCDLGCNASDFAGFTPNRVALIKRGGCTFNAKVTSAVAAGAVGVLIYNDGAGADRVGSFRGRLDSQPVPSFALSYATGVLLLQPGTAVRMAETTESYRVTTRNVLAETPGGDPTSVVTIGTHLDSVPEGPGINDNGSGSATNLEIAIAVHRLGLAHVNRVRFAWWGAEEIGLLGSRHYVAHLNATNRTALGHIALNLDFDMLASPNFQLGVYDGRNAVVEVVRNGSGMIQDIFTDYFDAHGYKDAWDLGPFDGRSDYAPFTEVGIPAGGIYGGAEKIKTEAERKAVGGLANAPFDPCYHQACDTVDNINAECFELMAKTAAHALQKVAMQAHLRAWLSGGLESVKIV